MHVVCDPNPFCFGSTSTMRAVLGFLPEAQVTVFGRGATLDLCGDLQVVPCDVRDPSALEAHLDVLDDADVYVAFSNNTNVERVVERGIPLVFVDILYWMKRRRTPAMDHAQVYVVENYPGVEEKLRLHRPACPLVVGPIVDVDVQMAPAKRPVLASIGGASSPDIRPGVNTDYPQAVVTMLTDVVTRMGLPRMPLAMGSEAVASVQAGLHIHSITMDQTRYFDHLRTSRVLLTSPGLNGPLEAFRLGVPVCYLPPQNLTQVFHLDVYVKAGLAPAGLNLPDLLPGWSVCMAMDEKDGTAAVLSALRRLDDAAWRDVADRVVGQLSRSDADLDRLAQAQRDWFSSLGTGGASNVADAIRECASCA